MMPTSVTRFSGSHHASEKVRMTPAGLIPADVSTHVVLALAAIGFISGLARGFSGFGSALIFMPLASSLAAPRLVAAVILIIDVIAALPLLPNAWLRADRPAIAIMVVGAAVGVPLGTLALTRLDPVTTRWIISLAVLALVMLLISGWRYRGPDNIALSIGIGGLSGFCSGLAQTPGPPIVAWWLGRPIDVAVARANIVLFFAATDLFSVASYALGGLINADAFRLSVIIGPVYAIGILLGAKLFGRVSEKLFRSICYAMIALAAIVGLPLLDGLLR